MTETVSRFSHRWAALAVLTTSLFVITMDMTILNIALPDISSELRPSSEQELWIVDSYSLVLTGLLVSCAAIADRWGRKRTLLLGYLIFAATSALVFFASTPGAVIALRALLGVGGAMIMPTTLSLIRGIFPDPGERSIALGLWAAASGLGAAVGPLVGGVLLENFSWHAAFLVNVPIMVLGLVAGFFLLPESRVSSRRWDAPTAVLSLAGIVLLVWSIKKFGKEESLLTVSAWTALAAATVLLAWFVVRNLRREEPLLELRMFANRPFCAGILAAMTASFAMSAILMLFSQWLQLVDGASAIQAGVRLLPAALAGAFASLAAPILARTIGARAVLSCGLAVAGLGMALIGLDSGHLSDTTITVSLSLVGLGLGSLAIGSAMIMHGTPEAKAGSAAALEESFYELGAVTGIAILGSIAALRYRTHFDGSSILGGLPREIAAQAEESIGSAVAIARELHMPRLATEAGEAFTLSLQTTGLVGGAILIAAAIAVFLLTPRGTDISVRH